MIRGTAELSTVIRQERVDRDLALGVEWNDVVVKQRDAVRRQLRPRSQPRYERPAPGAIVYISHALVAGASAPASISADGGVATTSASDTFSIVIPKPGNYYVEVFSPGNATVHEIITAATTGITQTRGFGLTTRPHIWHRHATIRRHSWAFPVRTSTS